MKRLACLLVLCAACSDTNDLVASDLNIDRPVDVAFACYGGLRITNGSDEDPSQMVTTSAMPISACDIRAGSATPAPVPPGQDDLHSFGGEEIPTVNCGQTAATDCYYAFILQSGPGTVAVAGWEPKPPSTMIGGDVQVIDTDPLTPGKNSFTVGDLPVAIATDKLGCYEVTANSGSCDMSALDIGTALDTTPGVRVNQFDVLNATGGKVRAKPAAMVGEPQSGTIGVSCGLTPSGVVYVAYPSCHAVAAIDTSTGNVLANIQFDATGAATVHGDGNLSCPDECDGGQVAPGTRPVALDLQVDPRSLRHALAIGADNSASITIVELDPDTNLPTTTVKQYALQDPTGTLGITSVSISPQIGMGGSPPEAGTLGSLNDDTSTIQMQFVYGVATDGSVRVAEILNVNAECDTQVDPRYLHDVKDVKLLSCLPVGGPNTPPRRSGARGPGIYVPPGAIPTSVATYKVDTFDGDTRSPAFDTLLGYFGVITASNGSSYVFNIDDDDHGDFVGDDGTTGNPVADPIPLDIAHQLRDSLPERDLFAGQSDDTASGASYSCDDSGPDPDSANGNEGGPRAATPPTQIIPGAYVSAAKAGYLPSIQQVLCQGPPGSITVDPHGVSELTFAAPLTERDAAWPDLMAMATDETVTLTYEGSLSQDPTGTAINGPPVRTGALDIDASGMKLDDSTAPFCNAGVEPYDVVQLRGCDPANNSTDCPQGYECFVHPESQVANLGACMLKTEASRLADACRSFLISLRRYTVGKATTGELVLLPRTHVLYTSPVDGCTSDAQCQTLATFADELFDSNPPNADNTPPDPHTFTCAVDPNRAPDLDATGNVIKRCIETCTVDTDCIAGMACQAGICMEGVIPPQACVNAPQKYDLRAGEAFTVVGTRTGYIHPIIADASGNCVRDPAAPPTRIGRIPLAAPACDPTADPRTLEKPDGTYGPNPCEMTVDQYDLSTQFLPGTCSLSNPTGARQTAGIRFQGPGANYTLVDPTYPGDLNCIGDRAGNLGHIPVAGPGFQITFRATAGFQPLALSIVPAYPVKVVRGPGQSIWVIDEGDFLSTSITESSTSGKVFRVETQNIETINTLE
ncbi:MAG TPA: hypothetical protein VLX92_19755 [Kofleriaceae bacterium]|nr:hypothetical protein [Kofleriaceae bacterium]